MTVSVICSERPDQREGADLGLESSLGKCFILSTE